MLQKRELVATSEVEDNPKRNPAAFELSYWDTIKNSSDPQDFKSYLQKYPDGQFVSLARNRIRGLEAGTQPVESKDPSGWVKFESTVGLFSILMPTQPTEQKETKDSASGPYTTTLLQSNKGNGEVCLAAWVDYDPKFNFDTQKEIEANRDNFVKTVKGTVVSTTRITHRGNPGIEFQGTAPNFSFKSRVYVVGRRPYMLIVLFPAGGESSPTINKFISSFELLPK